eukprot:scaffold2520_cov324-Prasinococcus_capsulatus_cf.AAC.6
MAEPGRARTQGTRAREAGRTGATRQAPQCGWAARTAVSQQASATPVLSCPVLSYREEGQEQRALRRGPPSF